MAKHVVNWMPVYEPRDCMILIKKKYPLIPLAVIKRVLYGEELYMRKVGIIDYKPHLSWWNLKQ